MLLPITPQPSRRQGTEGPCLGYATPLNLKVVGFLTKKKKKVVCFFYSVIMLYTYKVVGFFFLKKK